MFFVQLNKDKPETENKCSYKDLTKMTEDELLEGLFTDKENSPLYDDDEDNIITQYVDKKMEEFLESNDYYDEFLMKLCAVKGGKWIEGSKFGKTDSSFDRGSKCSYKTKKNVINLIIGILLKRILTLKIQNTKPN